jgi:hypothetical protein
MVHGLDIPLVELFKGQFQEIEASGKARSCVVRLLTCYREQLSERRIESCFVASRSDPDFRSEQYF